MNDCRWPKVGTAILVGVLVVAVPALADEITGKIKSIDRTKSEIVVADEKTGARCDGEPGCSLQGLEQE